MRRLRARWSSVWLKVALSAALLGLLIYGTDLRHLQDVLRGAHAGWLLVALGVYLGGQTMSAVRWCLLARPLGFAEPFGRFFACYFGGMYLNLFAPSTVAGDIGRALFLARGSARRALALTSVVADRGIGLIALIWVGAAAILLLPRYPLPGVLYWAAWLAPPAAVAVWLWGPLLAVRVLPAGNRWRVLVTRDLSPYWTDYRLLAAAFAIAALFHLVQVGTQIVLAWALGLPLPWSFFLIFVPAVNLAAMLPVTLSGIGIREGGYWYFLSLIGVDREAAIALGLVSSAVVLAAGLTGAPMLLALGQSPEPRSRPRRTGER